MSNGGEELCSAAGATELLCEYATMWSLPACSFS